MNEKQLAFFNSAEAIRQFPDPKARECVALGMKGEGPRVRGVMNDSIGKYRGYIITQVSRGQFKITDEENPRDKSIDQYAVSVADAKAIIDEILEREDRMNATPRYIPLKDDNNPKAYGVYDTQEKTLVKDQKFTEFQAQDMANTMNLKVVKNATDKNFKILQYVIRDWYEVCSWTASSKEEAERQFLAQNPVYKDRSIKAVETKKNATGTEKAYELYKGVQIMEDSGIYFAKGNHRVYQTIEELKKAIDEALKSKKNASAREDLITHIFNLKRLRDGTADYNKVEKDMQGKSDSELKRIIDSMQMTAKNSSPVLKEQFRANGAEMFNSTNSPHITFKTEQGADDAMKILSKYIGGMRKDGVTIYFEGNMDCIAAQLELNKRGIRPVSALNSLDPKTKARALGNALYGPKKNESTKTKDVLVRALKKGDVRWFNDGTSATVKYIYMIDADKFEIEFDNGKSVIQDGSTYCRVSALNSLDPKTKTRALGTELYRPKKNDATFRVGDRVISNDGQKGTVVNGEAGIFSVKLDEGMTVDVEEDETFFWKRIG